jgi:hypothetical protein
MTKFTEPSYKNGSYLAPKKSVLSAVAPVEAVEKVIAEDIDARRNAKRRLAELFSSPLSFPKLICTSLLHE